MYKRILVATDGSKLSKKAVSAAIGLASACEAELIAIKIIPRYAQSYFEGGTVIAVDDVNRIESQWSQDAQKVVDDVKKAATAKGISTKTLVVKSDVVSDALLATANKQKCDLIVMASHGRKGIKRLLLGSETQHVLTHATMAVLVLK